MMSGCTFNENTLLARVAGMLAMEYGSVAYMGAKPVHLDKLEKVQRIAQRIGNFECDSLSLRREAAAITTTLKLLSGRARGKLQLLIPELKTFKTVEASRSMKAEGIQLVSAWKHKYTLDLYSDSYQGSRHKLWEKLPQNIVRLGVKKGWSRIIRLCKTFIIHGINKCNDV